MEPNRPAVATRAVSQSDAGRGLLFLAAGLSFAASVYLFFSGHEQQGIFVGLWVPSILSAGSLLLGGSHE
jgi:hypothetical protein